MTYSASNVVMPETRDENERNERHKSGGSGHDDVVVPFSGVFKIRTSRLTLARMPQFQKLTCMIHMLSSHHKQVVAHLEKCSVKSCKPSFALTMRWLKMIEISWQKNFGLMLAQIPSVDWCEMGHMHPIEKSFEWSVKINSMLQVGCLLNELSVHNI